MRGLFEYIRKLLPTWLSNRNFRPTRFNSTGEAGNFTKRYSLLKEILP